MLQEPVTMEVEETAVCRFNLYDLTYDELTTRLAAWGYSHYWADKVWRYLYGELATAVSAMPDLRPDLQERLVQYTHLNALSTQMAVNSSDGYTRKFLLGLADGEAIETVLMRFEGQEDNGDAAGRATVCISTQAGCAMGCVFCATGQMGFRRHLTPGEIVGQVIYVERLLRAQGDSLRNIVLMGMGEPLHNYDQTMTAVSILMDHKGLALAPKHITLSTVGVVPGIRRLADEQRPFRLAVSLHAATDEERMALVPPARRWPLAELMDACRYYIEKRGRRIFFEWTLIEGQNDTPAQAHAVGQLLQGMDAHLNLIPLNPTTGYDGQPTRGTAVRQFQAILADYGLPSTVRQRRGIDVDAGCGQLHTRQVIMDDGR